MAVTWVMDRIKKESFRMKDICIPETAVLLET